MTVTALLISHEGDRWLPAVLAGLSDQQRRPDRVLAVDTGSTDQTVDLLHADLGPDSVVRHPGSFPEAVAHALPLIDTEWVWILHDDANPHVNALEALLDAAEQSGAAILGPKLREWPDLRRLLELGVTVSGSGRRETGLERGEYDQGQHEERRRVLAVNTAGMLVRRSLLEELDGFDRELPMFGNDIDFGWRAARAGHSTLVVPDAIVFHAEAAHRGVRRTPRALRRHTERRAALHTVLANSVGWRVVGQWFRLLFSSFLRIVGFLLARRPGLAKDELSAVSSVYTHPGRLRAARQARSHLGNAHADDVRRLLAPWWLPYRHGLDFVSDVASAVASQGRDAAERRRAQRAPAHGPAPEDGDELEADSSLLARLITSPFAVTATLVVLAILWGAREALGPIAGGALSPAPEAASDWWRLITQSWHPLGQGSDAPSPAYLLPMALAGTVLLGSAQAVVSLLFLLAVPFTAWGAYRFAKVAAELGSGRERSRPLVAWAAVTYALVPVASGAWGQGRFGIVVTAALLPWLAHAAVGFFESPADRRWRAGWRCGMLLALVAAFTPGAWLFAIVVIVLVCAGLLVFAPTTITARSVWGPLVVSVLAPLPLLAPGVVGILGHDLSALFIEAGRAMPNPGPIDLVSGRFPDPAAPIWMGVLLLVPALLALLRASTRAAVAVCWALVALAAAIASLLSQISIDLPAGETQPGLGFSLVIIQGALVVAVLIAAHGGARSSSRGPVWQRPIAAAFVAVALLVPVGGLVWWLVDGDNLLEDPGDPDIPAYMTQKAEADPANGVLVVRGSVEAGLDWTVRRGEGVTLGQDEILALTGVDAQLAEDVTRLVSRGDEETVAAMAARGVEYVVLPAPADAQVAAALDATSGLTQASTTERSMRAWEVDPEVDPASIDGDGPWWHPWLLALQVMAIVVVAVLCGPSRREER